MLDKNKSYYQQCLFYFLYIVKQSIHFSGRWDLIVLFKYKSLREYNNLFLCLTHKLVESNFFYEIIHRTFLPERIHRLYSAAEKKNIMKLPKISKIQNIYIIKVYPWKWKLYIISHVKHKCEGGKTILAVGSYCYNIQCL